MKTYRTSLCYYFPLIREYDTIFSAALTPVTWNVTRARVRISGTATAGNYAFYFRRAYNTLDEPIFILPFTAAGGAITVSAYTENETITPATDFRVWAYWRNYFRLFVPNSATCTLSAVVHVDLERTL